MSQLQLCPKPSKMSKISFSPNEETKIKVYEMFGRTKEQVEDDVKTITEWFQRQPHLPEVMAEAKIHNFLILNKFSIEKTKKKIDMYYTIRSYIPDWFDNANPKLPNMQKCLQNSIPIPHPKLHQGMFRVFFFKAKTPGIYVPKETAMMFYNFFEIRLQEECMVGDIFIVDIKNFSFEDILKLTLPVISKILAIYEKVYSLRIKAAYVINGPPIISRVLAIIKPLVKSKMFDRIHIENESILGKLFTEDYLPKEFGGKGPSLEEMREIAKIKYNEYQNRFDLLDHLRVDENLRPEELRNDEFLGFYGNFKKLSVD